MNKKPLTPESLSNYWDACLAVGMLLFPMAREASQYLDRLSGVWGFELIGGRLYEHPAGSLYVIPSDSKSFWMILDVTT